MTKRKNADQRGFTLIELLVAITMAGIILGAITMTFKSQHDSSL
ncbi:MAG: type II secretion system protein, partial [Deltaproteobacteria bacterium]|nr:type II secretion system protein [Deltaproteobacteria bacterium]